MSALRRLPSSPISLLCGLILISSGEVLSVQVFSSMPVTEVGQCWCHRSPPTASGLVAFKCDRSAASVG